MRAPRKPDATAQAEDAPESAGLAREDLPLGPKGTRRRWLSLKIILGVALWIGAYGQLGRFAGWLTYDVFDLGRHTHLGSSIDFFVTDVPKIFLLLAGIIPVVSIIRSYFSPEKVRRVVSGKGELAGTVLAALLGTVTPFCSCSAVPMFIGFLESGLPLGVTFAFLIASPVVNEVALVMLAGLFGLKIALLYVGLGLVVAIVGGTVIGRLHLESQVEDYVYKIKMGEAVTTRLTFEQRLADAVSYTKDILRRVFPWVLGRNRIRSCHTRLRPYRVCGPLCRAG